MDITYSEEQNLIAQQAREFFERECPLEKIRTFWKLEDGLPAETWHKMGEMGWLGALFPEALGGMGLGHTDLSRVLEEMGRALLSGAFLGHLMGGYAVLTAGNAAQRENLLPGAASGETRLALVRCGEGGRFDRLGGSFRVAPGRDHAPGAVRISGEKLAVPGLAQADTIVIAAHPAGAAPPEGAPSYYLVSRDTPGVTVRPLQTLDGGFKQASLTLTDVAIPAESHLAGDSSVSGAEAAGKIDAMMELALCFDALGGAQRVLEMTVAFARMRTAFGNPIGLYQAVKHKCADMLYAVENLRAIAIWAAWVLDVPAGESGADPASALAMARTTAIEGYNLAIRHGTQIHGAIGVTEEHDLHLFAKRAKTLGLSFGSLAHYHETVLRRASSSSDSAG